MPTKARSRRRAAQYLQRGLQGCSLGFFVYLLWRTRFPLIQSWIPVDAFLRLDPVMAVVLPLVEHAWIPILLPGLVVLIITLFLGRVFCGYICPMGTTLDVIQWLKGKKVPTPAACSTAWLHPRSKYMVLILLLAAATLGVQLVFWAAPIPLITRFYVLVLDPLLLLLGQAMLSLGLHLGEIIPLGSLSHIQILPRRYDVLFITAALLAGIFALEWVRPRTWCRCLCPAGALLALASFAPFWRRRVSVCNHCGLCATHCPTGAIAHDGQHTQFQECIACRRCVDICPLRGVQFRVNSLQDLTTSSGGACLLPARRQFLWATGIGLGLGALHYTEVRSGLASGKGLLQHPALVRPPGALPEADFLARCVRCGQCMKVCPSNGLQPIWLEGGMAGIFSPVLMARRGACEPDCNACGHVCPSAALRPLALPEKHWAKIGTAVIIPPRCLAWSMDKRCVVCQEVCPYGAIELVTRPQHIAPVPVVHTHKCFGCGYCENHCPVKVTAVVVEGFHAMRLSHGSYRAEGRAQGLQLEPGKKVLTAPPLDPSALPPGFSE